MARIYSQIGRDPRMNMIMDSIHLETAAHVLKGYASGWPSTKKGRTVKALSCLEYGLYYSDGKLAALIWADPCPPPAHENPFTPANGEIPGLKV